MSHRSRFWAVSAALFLVHAGAGAQGADNRLAAVPSARFEVDPQHSTVGFTARSVRVVKVRGRFREYSATVVYDHENPARSTVTALIRTASIDTDMDFRDRHLRSPDFFDAERHPTIRFVSERVDPRPGGLLVAGTLTMRGVARRITFPATIVLAPDTLAPSGLVRVAFEAHLKINRHDFGIAGGNAHNASYNPATALVGDTVDIDLELYALRPGFLSRTFHGQTPPSIADTVNRLLTTEGAARALQTYESIMASNSTAFNASAGQLNALGLQLLAQGRTRDAIAILEANDRRFPTTRGVALSLGDAYLVGGDPARATRAYERAVLVDSASTAAIEMLRRLKP